MQSMAAEQINTEYDADLGWGAKKSFAAPNMYGPGVALHTNARGFRGREAVEDAVPEGNRRVVCSGDSFTLGHGVGDTETWCAFLSTGDLQTVNMGQVGYGIDQAYLWYLRDGRPLAHHVHILAFVTDDFRRMALDRFTGYGKPVLSLKGDSIGVIGVPVPRRDGPRAARFKRVVQSLRFSEFLRRLTNADAMGTDTRVARLTNAEIREVTARLVADLARVNASKGSRFVLVYLPIERDFVNEAARPWRDQMRAVADSLGVPLVDLIPELRKRAQQDVTTLFIQPKGALPPDGMGHFTPDGHRWVAQHIRERLDSLGALSSAPTAAVRR